MAKPPEDTPKPKRRGASVFIWVLLAMIIAGLGGFGLTNFGNGVTSIGQVGTRDIDVKDYARSMQQELRSLSAQVGKPVSFAEAQALGMDQQILQTVIARTALDGEAERIGVSAGDAVVATEVSGMQAFQGTAGSFDRETYRLALQQNDLTEGEFEAGLRADVARSILQGAVARGFAAPEAMTAPLLAYAGEMRAFSLLQLGAGDLASPLPAPTDADLKAYHTANIAAFTRPEAKKITYVALLPDALSKDMAVDEAALQTLYQSRIDEFVLPEKRLVERLVFGTDAEAATAKARIDAGETFEALVAERDLTLEDVDLGDVAKADLGAAGDAVFALEAPGVVGPFASDLGPALFRMNAVLAAQETGFEEARPTLAVEMQTDAARRAIGDKVDLIDDALAGGATLEDVAREQGMQIATFDYAPGAADNDPIAGYPAFREAAAKLAEGDFPEAVLLEDGGVIALRLDATVPPTPEPLAEVRERVAEAWSADALAKALSEQAIAAKAAVEGGASLGAQGIVSVTPAITRQGFVEGTPPALIEAVFAMAPGELRVIEAPGFTGLVQLNSITPADPASAEMVAAREALAQQVEQGLAQDAFALFSAGLTGAAGISLDQAAINAVHAQFN